jgi:hypothetical protein
MPAAEDIPVAIRETPAVQRSYTRTAKGQPTGVAMPVAPTLPPHITANLTPPQRITANPAPPPLTPPRITANPMPPLLTPPQRMVRNPTVEAEDLMVGVENTTS